MRPGISWRSFLNAAGILIFLVLLGLLWRWVFSLTGLLWWGAPATQGPRLPPPKPIPLTTMDSINREGAKTQRMSKMTTNEDSFASLRLCGWICEVDGETNL